MITKYSWRDFNNSINYKDNYGKYAYSTDEAASLFILTLILTPFTIVLDILFIPIEIIYYICLKIIIKKRNKC